VSSHRRIHAILFDLDDMLIDWSGLTADYPVFMRPHVDNVYEYLAEGGHSLPDRDTFSELYLKTVVNHWSEAKKSWCAVNFGRVLEDFSQTLDLDVSKIDYHGMMCAYDAQPLPDVVLFSDTIPVLEQLRQQDYKIGLVTNSMLPMWMRDVELEAYEIIDFFVQIAVKPAGHRAFFDSHIFFALDRIQNIGYGQYAGRDTVLSHNFASFFDCQFCTIAMHVRSDIICTHESSFRIRVNCQTYYT
jgi:FMN phosphatase YigB (HAD superfamily)